MPKRPLLVARPAKALLCNESEIENGSLEPLDSSVPLPPQSGLKLREEYFGLQEQLDASVLIG